MGAGGAVLARGSEGQCRGWAARTGYGTERFSAERLLPGCSCCPAGLRGGARGLPRVRSSQLAGYSIRPIADTTTGSPPAPVLGAGG